MRTILSVILKQYIYIYIYIYIYTYIHSVCILYETESYKALRRKLGSLHHVLLNIHNAEKYIK
jgi:hypothetical protein